MMGSVFLEVAFAIGLLAVIALCYDLFRRSRPATPAEDPAALVPLRTSYAAGEVDIVRGLLQSHGIDAMVSTDDASGWRPEGLWRPGRVLVRQADLAEAEELLADVAAEREPT